MPPRLHAESGGVFLTIRDVLDACTGEHPLSIEGILFGVVRSAVKEHDVVMVGD